MQSENRFLLTGDIQIDALTHKAFLNKTRIKLSELSFKTMLALISAFPNPLSNDELIDQVWEQTEVSPETVTQRIAIIRKALNEAGADAKQYLGATRNVGYRWLVPVKKASAISLNRIKWMFLLLVFLATMFVIVFLFKYKESDEPDRVDVSSTVSASDLTQKAWNYLDKHNAQSNQLAIGLFRQALAVNQLDVNAMTGLSIALSHEVTKFNQSAELLIEARKTVQRAIEINPSHAQAWAALAFVDDAGGDINKAIKGYEKAIELAPKNSSTISSLSYLYAVKGRIVDALRLNVSVLGSKQLYLDLQIAQALNLLGFDVLAEQWYYKADILSPDNVFATHQRAQFYMAKNQQVKAKEVIKQAQERGIIRPELPMLLGLMSWKNGELLTAFTHFKTAFTIDDGDIQSYLLMQSLSSKNQQIKTQNHEWVTYSLNWPIHAVFQAQFHAQTGQTGLAFDALERAFKLGYRDFKWLQWLPAFGRIKSDDRWLNLISAMQNDVGKQRQQLLSADWLPTSFLDPQN